MGQERKMAAASRRSRGVDEHVAGVGDPEGAVIAGDTDKGYSECWPRGEGRGGRTGGRGGLQLNLFSSTISGRHHVSGQVHGTDVQNLQHPTAAGCLSSPGSPKAMSALWQCSLR